MLTYDEIIELREKLKNNEISTEEAKEIYYADFNENKKSWHTKDWQERRKHFIKDKCEQCGGTEILTLQHNSHPKKLNDYYYDAFLYFQNIFEEENANIINDLITKDDILIYIDNTPRAVFSMCPKCCGSYYSRRKEPQLVCSRCKNEFSEPLSKLLPEYIDDIDSEPDISMLNKPANAPGNRKVKHIMFYSDIKYNLTNQKIKQMLKEKYQKDIDKKAMLDFLDETIKYLSFEDTKTLCKKCAFNYDKNKRELCPICKKNYKSVHFETCIDCLPDGERKNKIKEQIEFSRHMRELHKSLGL